MSSSRGTLHQALAAVLFLLSLCLLVYHPALDGAALNFDDNLFFGPDNPEFADEGLTAILHPGRTIANAYLPVAHLSLYFDYLVAGRAGSLWWPHLHSLLLHVLAAAALARLAVRLRLSPFMATSAAALFLVHPALVESHSWLSSRKDLLSGLFVFLALSALAAQRPGSFKVAGFALLAIYAKATAIVLLPLMLLPVLLCGDRRRRLRAAAPAAVILALAAFHHTTIAAAEGTLQQTGLVARLPQVPGAFQHYLQVLFWPVELNVLHPEIQTLERFRANVVTGSLALVTWLLAGVLLVRRHGWRAVGLSLLAVPVALLPFNTVWPASVVAAADRYLYLAVPFAVLALAFTLARWRGAGLILLLLVIPLSAWGHQRVRAFKDSESLWRASLAVAPDNAVASLNLALAVVDQDRTEARDHAEQAAAVARLPEHRLRALQFLRGLAYADGRMEEAARLAGQATETAGRIPGLPGAGARLRSLLDGITVLMAAGRVDEARSWFAEARAIDPDQPHVLVQEAVFLMLDAPEGQRAEARRLLERALVGDPDHRAAMLVLGRLELGENNLMAARRWFRQARARDPQASDSYLEEVNLLLAHGSFRDAQNLVEEGLARGIQDPNLLVRLGIAMAGQGRLDAARERYEAYLTTRPTDPKVRRLLADVLATQTTARLYKDPPEKLAAAAARLRELVPDHPRADVFDAVVARQRRDPAQAIVLLERALVSLEGDLDLRRMLAESHRDRGYQLLMGEDRDSRDQALRHFRQFLDLAPVDPALTTEAAETALRSGYSRIEQRAVQSLLAGQLDEAEADFRFCIHLLPEESGMFHQLGLVLWQRGGEHLEEALHCFETAQSWQQERGLDAGLPALYRIRTLARLHRVDEARQVGEGFLATPGPAAADLLERIRAVLERL